MIPYLKNKTKQHNKQKTKQNPNIFPLTQPTPRRVRKALS